MYRILSNKQLTLRAQKYASHLLGIQSYKLKHLRPDDFSWHRETINYMHTLAEKADGRLLPHPTKANEVISAVTDASNIYKEFECWIFFENRIGLNFYGYDFGAFLGSLFRLDKSYDAQLAFTDPDFIISLSDDEHAIEMHIIRSALPSKNI